MARCARMALRHRRVVRFRDGGALTECETPPAREARAGHGFGFYAAIGRQRIARTETGYSPPECGIVLVNKCAIAKPARTLPAPHGANPVTGIECAQGLGRARRRRSSPKAQPRRAVVFDLRRRRLSIRRAAVGRANRAPASNRFRQIQFAVQSRVG